MLDEQIGFSKTPFVQQKVEPFTCCEPALGVLGVNALPPAAEPGSVAEVSQMFYLWTNFHILSR